jgi:hypothetical protein
MLRRKPTAIKLTVDDLSIYEEFRREAEKNGGGVKEESVGLGVKGRKGAGRDERIGVGAAGGGGGGVGMGIGGGGGRN